MANVIKRQDGELVRWGSGREMVRTERLFQGALRDLFGWSTLPAVWVEREEAWAPSLELVDKGDKYVARAELPGMRPEDMEISIGEEGLTISGERKHEESVKREDYLYEEHSYGSFSRVVPLPAAVEADKVEATYENGILEVTLPKTPEVKGKKIEITSRTEEKSGTPETK
jgi:HSP20 family protein